MVFLIKTLKTRTRIHTFSIPDYGLRITNFGSWISVPDPNNNKKEKEKKICCLNFISSYKIHKIEKIFIFEQPQKNIRTNRHKMKYFLAQKIDKQKLAEIWVWDPR